LGGADLDYSRGLGGLAGEVGELDWTVMILLYGMQRLLDEYKSSRLRRAAS